jgi:hypothetical protein
LGLGFRDKVRAVRVGMRIEGLGFVEVGHHAEPLTPLARPFKITFHFGFVTLGLGFRVGVRV